MVCGHSTAPLEILSRDAKCQTLLKLAASKVLLAKDDMLAESAATGRPLPGLSVNCGCEKP